MPTYQYSCSKCGHEFELFQSMKDSAIEICPEDKCGRRRWGKGRVQRQLGAGAGLIFKGSGFYITDYRSESYKNSAKNDAPKSGTATSTGDSKTSTPAATPPAKGADKPSGGGSGKTKPAAS